jgi:hypothetical protein
VDVGAHRYRVHYHTFKAFEGLEELDQAHGTNEFRVLGRYLYDNLKILPDVCGHHILQDLIRLVDCKPTKIVDEPLSTERVSLGVQTTATLGDPRTTGLHPC